MNTPAERAPGSLEGTLLGGRFRLTELLRRDPLGELWRAEESGGGAVSVRVFTPAGAGEKARRKALGRDLKGLRAVDASAQGVAPCLDFDLDGEVAWAAFAGVPRGVTLRVLLAARGPAPRGVALRLGWRIAHALAALHAQRALHRNLGAHAVLLDVESLRGPWVEEDALAPLTLLHTGEWELVAEKDPLAAYQSQPDAYLGEADYFAPEQVEGEFVDDRTDVYAWGLLLHELLTGKAPFHAESLTTVLKRQLYEDPLSPRTTHPEQGLTEDEEFILSTACAKDRDERFATVAALLGALGGLGFEVDAGALQARRDARDAQARQDAARQAEAAREAEEAEAARRAAEEAEAAKKAAEEAEAAKKAAEEAEAARKAAEEAEAARKAAEEAEAAKRAAEAEEARRAAEAEASSQAAPVAAPSTDEGAEGWDLPEVVATPGAAAAVEAPADLLAAAAEAEARDAATPTPIPEAAPAEVTPAEVTPAEAAPAEATPVEAAPAAPAPADEDSDEDSDEDGDEDGDEDEESPSPAGAAPEPGRSKKRKKGKGKKGRAQAEEKPAESAVIVDEALLPPAPERKPTDTAQITGAPAPAPSPAPAPERPEPELEFDEVAAPAQAASAASMDAWFAYDPDKFDEESGQEEKPFGGRNIVLIGIIAVLLLVVVGGVALLVSQSEDAEQAAKPDAAQSLQALETRQAEQRRATLQALKDAAAKGALVPPEEETAYHLLGRLRTESGERGSAEYEEGFKVFVERATAKMKEEADIPGGGRAQEYADYILQFDKENSDAKKIRHGIGIAPLPEPDVEDGDVDGDADGDAAALDGDAAASPPDQPAEAPTDAPPVEPPPAEALPPASAPAPAATAPPATATPAEPPAQDSAATRQRVEQLLKEAASAKGQLAVAKYREVLKLDPRNHRAHFNIGQLLSQQGDYPGALPHLERAVQLSGRNASYRIYLGNAYLKTSATAKAKEQYQKALEIEPGNATAKRMLERL